MIITDRKGRILFCGFACGGRTHDFTIFKSIFENVNTMRMVVWVDLGFLGLGRRMETDYLFIPFKASKNHPLDDIEKEYNRIVPGLRVKVEHAMANLKTFFLLRSRNRMRDYGKLDDMFDACARLANLRLSI